MRFSRRPGAALASVGVGKVELLGRGYWHPPAPANLTRRVIAVGSTGGRVGKSTVAAHLAVAMANLGAQVIAVDMDLVSPSLHALFGVERPAFGLQALLDDQIQNLDSSLTRTAVRNLHLLTGGVPGRQNDRQQLLTQLGALEGDVVILDLGGGGHAQLLESFSLSTTKLLVAGPQTSSLATTFELLRHAAATPGAFGGGGSGKLIGNLASNAEEIGIFHAFSRLVDARLGIGLPVAGCVRNDGRLAESAALGRSPVVGGRLSESARVFHLMAEVLLHQEMPAPGDTPAASARQPGTTEPAGAPLTEELLASNLDLYRRKHVRHEVDWTATLDLPQRKVAVRVVDISMSGAALEVVSELRLGESGTLVFDQLAGRPALPITLKSVDEPIRRAGVAFIGPEAARQQVIDVARGLVARRP
jgi:MinD-like ATPase involved in chromosome partitioning or flagellar assembly